MSAFEQPTSSADWPGWWRFSDAGIAGGPCEDGPAYGNRPSTNPRGAGARLWGFEDSAATVWVVRWLRDGIYLGQLVV